MTNLPEKKPIDSLKAIIDSPTVQEQFKNAMGKHSDLFTASLIDVFNDGLQDCEPASIVTEALKAAVLKLPVSKSLGFAYLVPYKKKYKEGNRWKEKKIATFQIGYKGLIQLAMRSGQVAALNGGAVFEGEFKSFNKMTGVVDISGTATSDKAVGYFVYMKLINGFEKTEYWTKEKVMGHAKEKSQSYRNDKSAWTTDFDAMATKTVLRSMLSKYAPMSVDFIAAISVDDVKEIQEPEIETIQLPEEPKKTKAKSKKSEPKEDPKPEQTEQPTAQPAEGLPAAFDD
jgi:recombination protein RecT